ncbi:MAG: glutamyl-tRNA reductase [Actinomycetota bacterium]
MSVLVVGLNYRGAPVDLLERFAFAHAELPTALPAAASHEGVREVAILSTCNRTEVYATVTGFHAGLSALRRFLSTYHDVPLEGFADRLYSLYGEDAVGHLFGVAAGVDSMVLGEPQILAQVRRAFGAADEHGSVGTTLSALFRRAISVGRRARAETDIERSTSTLAHAAASMATKTLGGLSGRTVLVIGAGEMGDLAAMSLAKEGMTVIVANRTVEHARAVAGRIGGRAVGLEGIAKVLVEADLVIASTGSPHALVTHEAVAAAMAARPARPMVLLDLAVPRDIEPTVAMIAGATLADMDDVREAVAPEGGQLLEIERVRAIIGEEVEKFSAWQRTHALAPLLSALHGKAERIRVGEIRRAERVLGDLGPRERDAIEALTRSIVAKLLHHPVTELKARAGTSEGELLARALRTLHALDGGND